ncbi:unnamed protein product [Pieris macdunnoughi]|uniref:Uncharacterized protein n=1 Tax=Pieris macdunnoughi TaxID=345717 RepID=A0A821W4N7_9NEOP|nr:unnamed protein product [Pieris macdunnoughi]
MGAARHASAFAPAALASGGAGVSFVRGGSGARAARATLGEPKPYYGHLAYNTDVPQESLSSASAGWHRQRHHRRQQRLQ